MVMVAAGKGKLPRRRESFRLVKRIVSAHKMISRRQLYSGHVASGGPVLCFVR